MSQTPSAAELYLDALAQDDYQLESPDTRYVVPDTRVLVASDAHVPYIDYNLLKKMHEDIIKYKVTAVVWLGDFMDMHEFSRFGVTDHKIDYQQTKKAARHIIEETARVLGMSGQQIISLGNHDARWMSRLDNYENLSGLYQSVGLTRMIDDGEVFISENPTLEAVELDGTTEWVLQHPFKFRAPLGNPSKLAADEHKNAMCAHAHHFASKSDGKYWNIESGGLFDPRKFTYVYQAPANMGAMVSGYWVLIEDEPPIGKTSTKFGPRATAARERATKRTR